MFDPFWLISEYLTILNIRLSTKLAQPPSQWKLGKNGNVVLIQGWNSSWRFLKIIGDHVNMLGFRVHVINDLGKNILPLDQASTVVSDYIIKNNLKKVIILTHSKGGLVAAGVLKKHPQNIAKIISICTPWQGSLLGYLKTYFLEELLPGSPVIANIKNHLDLSRIINIYAAKDNHVIPNKNLLIPQAINICVPVYGHARILTSPKTLALLSKLLNG